MTVALHSTDGANSEQAGPAHGPPAPVKPAEKTIIVVPDQHHDHIERRRKIRETFHDSQSRTIKADRDDPGE